VWQSRLLESKQGVRTAAEPLDPGVPRQSLGTRGKLSGLVLVLLLLASSTLPARAEESIVTKRVQFAHGSSSATVKGVLKGDEIHDYVIGAKAGQTMNVSLQTSSTSAYFNVLPPGSEAALFIGSTSGNQPGTLPADGDYRVRVYLMRSARRNETANYTVSVGITGSADAKVAGTPYHATGMVPCSVGTDPKGSAQCSFGVIRSSPGHAQGYLASPGFDVILHKDQRRLPLRLSGKAPTASVQVHPIPQAGAG
jgi:hypothetical protein